MSSVLASVRAWFPRGSTLDDVAFAARNRILVVVLALHIPALAMFGVIRGHDIQEVAAQLSVSALALAGTAFGRTRRLQSLLTTIGLTWSSAALVSLSEGATVAHFHFFIVVSLIALYQDWLTYLWSIVFVPVALAVGEQIPGVHMFEAEAARERPVLWALIHGLAILMASSAQILLWRSNEREQQKAAELTVDLTRSEEQSATQASYAHLYLNLARRNQALLQRQLQVIDDLEQREENPELLEKLFTLDHLATRVRRNAESLLVLAGEESGRRWTEPAPLLDVVRGAISEVEDFQRVDIDIDATIQIAGTAISDTVHLLAEVVENALQFSPPTSRVSIATAVDKRAGWVLLVEDQGVGLSDDARADANDVLANPRDLDPEHSRQLGFHVIGRLGARHGMRIALLPTKSGGTTAIVQLPADVLHGVPAAPVAAPATPSAPAAVASPATPPAPAPTRVAIASSKSPVGEELAVNVVDAPPLPTRGDGPSKLPQRDTAPVGTGALDPALAASLDASLARALAADSPEPAESVEAAPVATTPLPQRQRGATTTAPTAFGLEAAAPITPVDHDEQTTRDDIVASMRALSAFQSAQGQARNGSDA